jgi:hypothetical protein
MQKLRQHGAAVERVRVVAQRDGSFAVLEATFHPQGDALARLQPHAHGADAAAVLVESGFAPRRAARAVEDQFATEPELRPLQTASTTSQGCNRRSA